MSASSVNSTVLSRLTTGTHNPQLGKHRIGRYALTKQPPDFHPLVIGELHFECTCAPLDYGEVFLRDRSFGEADTGSTP